MRRIFIIVLILTPSAQASAQQPVSDPSHAAHASATLFPPRDTSGTAWLPDFSPMYGVHRQAGGWELMLHGNLFAQYLFESGEEHRRSEQAGSINWVMGMARRPLGKARLGLRAMGSVEPWTISGCGYPDLLATGEVCGGDTIHDRQHPHDLFMELAVEYDRPFVRALRWQIYAGLAGEPALGPPAFPHRLSAFANPIASITHHWFDSTHITFGVVTLGVYGQRWKAEGSAFNGREPDPQRTDLDLAALDSVSGRLSFAPGDRVAVQVSAAHLQEAEAGVGSLPPTDVTRITASGIYHRPFAAGSGVWATTLAYGVNSELTHIPGDDFLRQTTHAVLLESSATIRDRHTWFGRLDVVGKPAHDLHVHEFIALVFTVGKLQAGYVRHLKQWNGLVAGVGASVSTSFVAQLLAPRYGGRLAPGFGVFFNLRPAQHATR